MQRARANLSGICLIAVLTSLGCGGGGGGPALDALSGSYWLLSLGGNSQGGGTAMSATGTAVADGHGVIAFDAVRSDGGSAEPHLWSGSYAVGPGRDIGLVVAGETTAGGLAGDGSCAVGASTTEGATPSLSVLLARGAGASEASLSGAYHWIGFGGIPDTSVRAWGGGLVHFDGSGGLSTGPYRLNWADVSVGDISERDPAGTYAVTADGEFRLQWLTSPTPRAGGILPGSDVIVVGCSSGECWPGAYILLREGSGLGDESFRDDYWTVGVLHGNDGRFASFTGTLRANGAGGYTLDGTRLDEGHAPTLVTDSGTYGVAPNGALSTTASGGNTGLGGVSPDGRFFTIAGGMEAGQERFAFFGVRK